jgi:ubiquinone/menaquinone biosynthesis C-methylase UbiE
MDTWDDVIHYDQMDHSAVNAAFVADLLCFHGPCRGGEYLDVGTGTARIPIALAQADPVARILAVDLSPNMLTRARENISGANLDGRIRCQLGDVKALSPGPGDSLFEVVCSNTIVHHIPDPLAALAAMRDRVAPGGTLFVRDLARPESVSDVARLVIFYAGSEAPRARDLFEASLHAALTLEEIRELQQRIGIPPEAVEMTSDRHWTIRWRRPA